MPIDILNNDQKIADVAFKLERAVKAKDNVNGLTHNFYRYPARFSPKFVSEAIKLLSKPGDLILDPFAGGGTTLVEAMAANRHSVGFDVSPIASFVSTIKTTILSEEDYKAIRKWAEFMIGNVKIEGTGTKKTIYHKEGYLNNLPWPIRRLIEVLLVEIDRLSEESHKNFLKCALLRTAQWSVDCRKTIPTARAFRKAFYQNINDSILGISDLATSIKKNSENEGNIEPMCIFLNQSAETLNNTHIANFPSRPKLVITSPPYVGVHILYHQWQVNSRKRTRAPFWIINSLDGHGSGFYTFGHYQSHSKHTYFEIAEKSFSAIHNILADDGLIVQLVGFSNQRRYLPKYLEMMSNIGFDEIALKRDSKGKIKRIWRNVPNRKWYNSSKENQSSGKEVLLIHKKR